MGLVWQPVYVPLAQRTSLFGGWLCSCTPCTPVSLAACCGSVLLMVVCSHIAFYAIGSAFGVPRAQFFVNLQTVFVKSWLTNHLGFLIVGLHVCAMDCNPKVQLPKGLYRGIK